MKNLLILLWEDIRGLFIVALLAIALFLTFQVYFLSIKVESLARRMEAVESEIAETDSVYIKAAQGYNEYLLGLKTLRNQIKAEKNEDL